MQEDTRGYQRLARASGGLFLSPRSENEFKNFTNIQSTNTWETIMFREDVDVGCGDHLINWTIPVSFYT